MKIIKKEKKNLLKLFLNWIIKNRKNGNNLFEIKFKYVLNLILNLNLLTWININD